jgi:hypothetical protein
MVVNVRRTIGGRSPSVDVTVPQPA